MDSSVQNEARRSRLRVGAVLSGMRIRKKLIFLHTCFSLVLAGILALALRPAVREVVARAEVHEAETIARHVVWQGDAASRLANVEGVSVREGGAEEVAVSGADAQRLREAPGEVVTVSDGEEGVPRVGVYDAGSGRFVVVGVKLEGARRAVVRLYVAMTVALLAVYALVAAALEVFVLPEHVYEPIRRLLTADLAVREGRRDEEIIPERAIPRDELGEIMRSRNESITAMRTHERDLAAALRRLEEVATDLKRKNYLLEAARRNLADADRLASLGVMSAGLAHEMNTPLAVLKGTVEKLRRSLRETNGAHGTGGAASGGGGGGGGVTPAEADLMARVVARLERLSESLLDFARVRPAETKPTGLRPLVVEAWTLVSLDREARRIEFVNRVTDGTIVECDGDRIEQVLVNLIRNAVDALNEHAEDPARRAGPPVGARIEVGAQLVVRDGREWISVTITDNGPGIDPEVLPRLFEPFASTRLDSRGTGLGLAVSEGIISEHGGLLLARNRRDGTGAVFEIVLPVRRDDARADQAPAGSDRPAEQARM